MKIMKPRIISAAAVALMAVGALAACAPGGSTGGSTGEPSEEPTSAAPPFETVQEGCITVAFLEGTVPRVGSDGSGGITGYEGQLITKLADKYGLDICPFPTDFNGTILSVAQGQADIATSLYWNEERSKQVYFGNQMVLDTLVFVFPASINFTGPDSLQGLTWGAVGSWTYTEAMQNTFGAENVVIAPGTAEVYSMLKNGQVDASVNGNVGPALTLAKENPQLQLATLKPGDLGLTEAQRVNATYNIFGCTQGGKDLAAAYNVVLAELIESGEWLEILASYGLPDDSAIPPVNAPPPSQGC